MECGGSQALLGRRVRAELSSSGSLASHTKDADAQAWPGPGHLLFWQAHEVTDARATPCEMLAMRLCLKSR